VCKIRSAGNPASERSIIGCFQCTPRRHTARRRKYLDLLNRTRGWERRVVQKRERMRLAPAPPDR